MSSESTGQSRGPRVNSGSRREVVVALLLGAAGAGVIFLANRQGWAQVRTVPPKPLPASQVTVTGSALVPYMGALALAGLATLAAVLASRGLARRLTGVLLVAIGASLAVSAFTATRAAAISAASSTAGPVTAGAGSVTDGNAQSASVPNVAGTAPHVTFTAGGWQALVVIGALAMISAGLLVVWRANQMAVMSGRYDSPTAPGKVGRTGSGSGPKLRSGAGAMAYGGTPPTDSASIWEALSRGDDPTAADTGSQKARIPPGAG